MAIDLLREQGLYDESEEDTQKDLYLTFSLGKDFYCIEIRNVIEIIKIQAITHMPELPEYLKGIINLRGKIIPVMDVRIRFKKEQKEYDNRTCIIIVDIKGISIGLIVDLVSEVIKITDEEIIPPPDVANSGNRFVYGISNKDDQVKLILDCEKLLTDDDAENLLTL